MKRVLPLAVAGALTCAAPAWADRDNHMGCDDIGNHSTTALDQMSDAAAHATIVLAQTKRLFPSTASAVETGAGAGPTGGHSRVEAPSRGL